MPSASRLFRSAACLRASHPTHVIPSPAAHAFRADRSETCFFRFGSFGVRRGPLRGFRLRSPQPELDAALPPTQSSASRRLANLRPRSPTLCHSEPSRACFSRGSERGTCFSALPLWDCGGPLRGFRLRSPQPELDAALPPTQSPASRCLANLRPPSPTLCHPEPIPLFVRDGVRDLLFLFLLSDRSACALASPQQNSKEPPLGGPV